MKGYSNIGELIRDLADSPEDANRHLDGIIELSAKQIFALYNEISWLKAEVKRLKMKYEPKKPYRKGV